MTITWRDLQVWNEGELQGTLGEYLDEPAAHPEIAHIERSADGSPEWIQHYVTVPGEEPDWDTPHADVDWVPFWAAYDEAMASLLGRDLAEGAYEAGGSPGPSETEEIGLLPRAPHGGDWDAVRETLGRDPTPEEVLAVERAYRERMDELAAPTPDEQDLRCGWCASWLHSASSYGQPVYLPDGDYGQPHSLEEAIAAGMLAAVRQVRGHSQDDAARIIGVTVGAVRHWEQRRHSPTGQARRAVEAYILQRA